MVYKRRRQQACDVEGCATCIPEAISTDPMRRGLKDADAGADVTLLRKSDCEMLGYPLEAGELRYMGGVCTGLIKTYLHKVQVKLGTVEFPCTVAFAEREEVPCPLGRADIFGRFRVCYDDQNRMTDFILRRT